MSLRRRTVPTDARAPSGHNRPSGCVGPYPKIQFVGLGRSSGYRPYEATRAFWERSGFVYVDLIDPLPGWQPGNPAAIYVAALRPTRLPGRRGGGHTDDFPGPAESPYL